MRPVRASLLALILVVTSLSYGQTAAEPPAASPDLAGIAHIALRVANLEASEAFYQSLGFERPFELSRDGRVYEAFIKINDRQFIELYPVTPKDTQVGFLHICFEGQNLAAARAFYLAHGLRPSEISKGGAGNLLFEIKGLATPQGPQNIEYTQYMPGSMHSNDFGKDLGKGRISTELLSVRIPFFDVAAARKYYVNQVGFMPAADERLSIPGAHEETISLAPAEQQHFQAWFTLRVGDLDIARKQLLARKLLPPGMKDLTIMDPDGNRLAFAETH